MAAFSLYLLRLISLCSFLIPFDICFIYLYPGFSLHFPVLILFILGREGAFLKSNRLYF